MNKLAILLPTKGRPQGLKTFLESFDTNQTGYADVFPIIDEDELDLYGEQDNLIVSKAGSYLVTKLNGALSDERLKNYDYVSFQADDIVIHTKGFDKMIIDEFNNSSWQILHFEDLLHHGKLANHWTLRMRLVKEFGFIILPVLIHMFGDNFWTTIGNETNSIKFMPEIVFEHRHFMTRKATIDDTYKRSDAVFQQDQQAYKEFMNSDAYFQLVDKLNKLVKDIQDGN